LKKNINKVFLSLFFMARSNTIKYFSIYFLCYCQRLKKNDPSFIEEEEELHNNISKEAKNHHIVFL